MEKISSSQLACIIEKLKVLLQGEKHLKCSNSDEFLLRFIRASNYNVTKSFQLIKNYFGCKIESPEAFVYSSPRDYESIVSRIELGFVHTATDFHGRRIMLLRLGDVDPGRDRWAVLIQAATLVLDWLSLDATIQETGVCFVIDCTDFSLKLMKWATPYKLRVLMKFLQECVPLKFEAIHLVNAPIIFNIFFAAVKPFLKENLVDQIIWHKRSQNTLHNYMNVRDIPDWLGGELDLEEVRHWFKDVFAKEAIFKEYSSMGYEKSESPKS